MRLLSLHNGSNYSRLVRLMDENQTLYKLKEWEYVERICEKVGSINLSGDDLPAQLVQLLTGGKK